MIDDFVDVLYLKLGNFIYGEGVLNLEEVLIKLAIKRRATISLAESCTGGLIGNRITNISNSSKVFKGGVVVYSNQSKIDLLGIDKKVLGTCR